jgi:hypothetical protein
MRLFFVIVLSLFCVNVYGQDFDHLMVKKQLDCSDISYNCAQIFEKYYSSNKLDSAKSLLIYWQSKCGLREPLQRCKILLAIKQNSLNDSLLSDNVFYYLFNYKNRMSIGKYGDFESYDNNKAYYGYIPAGQDFDAFTKKSFTELKVNFTPDVMEYLLCEFYSDNSDTLFFKLQTNTFKNSILAKEYKKLTMEFQNLPEYHVAWITGMWIPTGAIRPLGVHPDLGFMSGIKYKKVSYDLTMTFKFLDTPESYLARRSTSSGLESTNHFFGGYMGFDVGRDIFFKNNHEIQLMGGIAFEGFDALEEDLDLGLESASANTLNLNLGFGYRYYYKNDSYLGLRVKYNFVDYTSNHVIDFTGNPITIQFVIGGLTNDYRNRNLKALRFKQR